MLMLAVEAMENYKTTAQTHHPFGNTSDADTNKA